MKELVYITAQSNLGSIFARGLLSHHGARSVPHVSVAMESVQDIRAKSTVPGGKRLHQYVNLYFNARNTMLYVLDHTKVCVVSIKARALDLPGVVVTDCNAAATGYVEYGTRDEMLPKLDYDEIFAHSWNHADYFEKRRHKARMCAEILVPHPLPPDFIRGVYMSTAQGVAAAKAEHPDWNFKVNATLFFR